MREGIVVRYKVYDEEIVKEKKRLLQDNLEMDNQNRVDIDKLLQDILSSWERYMTKKCRNCHSQINPLYLKKKTPWKTKTIQYITRRIYIYEGLIECPVCRKNMLPKKELKKIEVINKRFNTQCKTLQGFFKLIEEQGDNFSLRWYFLSVI